MAFARVVPPDTARVPVAIIFAPVKFPVKYPLPETSRRFEGEVVPIPIKPFVLIAMSTDLDAEKSIWLAPLPPSVL